MQTTNIKEIMSPTLKITIGRHEAPMGDYRSIKLREEIRGEKVCVKE
jgi:hypothetical protein